MNGFKIYTDSEEFTKEKKVQFITDKIEPVKKIHEFVVSEGILNDTLNEFLNRIGNAMGAEGMCIPRSGEEKLGTSSGRGMDALSKILIGLNVTREKYQRVMAFSYGGFLEQYYVGCSNVLKTEK